MTASRKVLGAIVLMAGLFGVASTGAAQDVGVRAGISGEPDQFYFGVHAYTQPVVERLRFRPNLEVGLGNDATVTTVNLEFVYPMPIRRTAWSILPGGGPALVIASHNSRRDTGGGFNILLGLEHRDGFFTELKIGAMDSPDIKFGIGYTMGR